MASVIVLALALLRLSSALSTNESVLGVGLWSLPPHNTFWPGWEAISHMFVFGDSYSTTSFNYSGDQPSPANPLGNPAFPGTDSSNGPNWVDFITETYNTTLLETANLAWGGAKVDTDLIPSVFSTISMKQQIENEYLPKYSKHPSFFKWRAWDTLFAIFIGINDVNDGYHLANNGKDVYGAVIAEYASLVDKLYQTGARNFLFLNVPPIDVSPAVKTDSPSSPGILKPIIAAWNQNVSRIAHNLSATYPDASTFVFDTNSLWDRVLSNPDSYVETSAYKNLTDFCPLYAFGTPSWYTKSDQCEYSVDEYLWLNSLHPGFRIHNATAKSVVEMLGSRQPWW